jgi:hypothetical protein
MSADAPRRLAAPDRRRALALLGITRWERRVRGAVVAAEAQAVVAAAPAVAAVPAIPAIPLALREPSMREPAPRTPPSSASPARPPGVPASPLEAVAARPTLGRTRLAIQLNDDAGATPLQGPYRTLLLQVLLAVDVLPMDAIFNPTGDDDLPELVLGGAPRRDDALLGPPLAVLRANPRAKRNLWPMLRRLARRLRR